MKFRERAVETVKMMGEELTSRADELIPNANRVKEINIWLRIPSLSDDPDCLPEIQVSVDTYPSREIIHLIRDRNESE